MINLTGHHSNPKEAFQCFAEILDKESFIEINFRIENYRENTDKNFGFNYKENIGLWNFDVAEAFLSFSDSKYLELQTSPLNQPFSYMIVRARMEFYTPDDLNFVVENKVDNKTWKSTIRISKEDIPGSGELVGNIFVCLGPQESRSYFALTINKEDRADFHRPDLFRKLL